MRTIDEDIARRIQEAADSGELARAKGYGQPMDDDAGWHSTPAALRVPMKILKDAGVVPAEVAWFHERARLKAAAAAASDDATRAVLQRQLVEIEQKIALRLEALRIKGALRRPPIPHNLPQEAPQCPRRTGSACTAP